MNQNPARVVLIGENNDSTKVLERLVKSSPEFSCKTLFSIVDMRALTDLLVQEAHDIVLVNDGQGMQDLPAFVKGIRRYTNSSILVYTLHASDRILNECIGNGADGYLLKTDAHAELVQAIRNLSRGGKAISASLLGKLFGYIQQSHRGLSSDFLSQRENEILKHYAKGSTYKEVAQALFISVETVRTHTRNIYRKLSVKNRYEALKKLDILQINDPMAEPQHA